MTLGRDYNGRRVVAYPYLRVANVQDGHIDLSNISTVYVPEAEARLYLLQRGDVLMNEGGDPDKLGRGSVWHGDISPCLHQNHVFCVRPHGVIPEWLDAWTSTLNAKMYFESRSKQTTNLASISSRNIREMVVPLPPPEEQSIIIKKLSDGRSRAVELEETLRRSISLLKELRSALITAAVTGQIALDEMGTRDGEGREPAGIAAPPLVQTAAGRAVAATGATG